MSTRTHGQGAHKARILFSRYIRGYQCLAVIAFLGFFLLEVPAVAAEQGGDNLLDWEPPPSVSEVSEHASDAKAGAATECNTSQVLVCALQFILDWPWEPPPSVAKLPKK